MSTSRSRVPQRRSPRLAVALPGRLGGRTPRDVEVLDLSLTGCLVRCEALYDRDAILDLTLTLEATPLTAKVRVVDSYVDGGSKPGEPARHLCGLRFLSLQPREEARLRAFFDEETRRRRGADTAPR